MWTYKIAMATFRTSQCQDGIENSKFYEWRCEGGAFKDALENLNARKSTSKNILTGILDQIWNLIISLAYIGVSSPPPPTYKFQAEKGHRNALWNKPSRLILSPIVVKMNRKRCTLLFAMYIESRLHQISGFYHLMKTKTRDLKSLFHVLLFWNTVNRTC